MRLKSLEVVGFKSFLEPTNISFAPGITAVVGPNGCGKSNVVDAIRWVLGEQAPTRLRGKTIEDLIYCGNDSHPAAGMAEVSLLLEAEDGNPLPDPYSALSEIHVTRRIYRSGDSEYLLNKIPCRLKDITEFFMAAQIHARGYSIIEQGKIEEIIQAKPAELRSLIEEAAGLSLFKGRREMSERKLERVRENMDRLNDVLAEIERQLNYARRQAKKAEAFKAIRQELDSLERIVAGRRLINVRTELDSESEREQGLRNSIGAAREQVAGCEGALQQASAELQAQRDELLSITRELETLRSGTAERARTRSFMEKRIAAIEDAAPRLDARIGELEIRATAARASRAEIGAKLARESMAEDGIEPRLKELRTRNESLSAEVDGAEHEIERIKDLISELMREGAVLRGRVADLSGERTELASKIENAEDHGALEESVTVAAAAFDQSVHSIDQLRADVESKEIARNRAIEREHQARAILEQDHTRLAVLREAASAALRHVETTGQNGAQSRLRSVLEHMNGDGPGRQPRMLTEVLRAPASLGTALTAVLGEQMGSVIVDTPSFAVRAVEVLKEKQSGRLSFVPESMVAVSHQAISAPGIEGRLVDMLDVEPTFTHVAEAMLGHVLVAEDLRSALAASSLNGHGTVFVTRDGDVVWPGSIISGGSAEVTPHVTASLEEASEKLAVAERHNQGLKARLAQCVEVREQANSEFADSRRILADGERELSDRRMAHSNAEQKLALARGRHSEALRRIDEIDKLIPTCNERMQEVARLEQTERDNLASARSKFSESKNEADQVGAQLLEAAAKFEARRTTLGGLERELEQWRQMADQLESQIVENRSQLESSEVERAEFKRELVKLAEQDTQAAEREQEIETNAEQVRERCELTSTEVGRLREELESANGRLKIFENDVVECGLRRERARALNEELSRAFLEKFQVEFEAARSDLETQMADRNSDEDEIRLKELRAKAERIGEVNLAAESEVRDLEERAATLGAQKADLEAAVKDLSQTIQKLNREARRRFAETFEGAAKNFAEVLPKLMRGAKGHLELATPDDLLESGVNILVQPAGKKVRDISLLSGGEKALSAMGLVFSLFLLNPSPFCLLDEVDAPLDEFSVANFGALVRDLKERSQFILITHNQRTMQSADHIHGVTMEQPGISRVISMKLPEAA